MSDTLEGLRHQINGAKDLESMVRTMKVLAASNIIQYEKAVGALKDYYRTVELGLAICLLNAVETPGRSETIHDEPNTIGAVVFGSDQGLVGQFNDVLCDYVVQLLTRLPGEKRIWAVGERMKSQMEDHELPLAGVFVVPSSIQTITSVVGQILLESQTSWSRGDMSQLYLFHNKPKQSTYFEPTVMQLLPLDDNWRKGFAEMEWPTRKTPEAMNGIEVTLHGLIRSYLFVSLYKACAESMASENASRLASMQRAEKNIDELLEDLNLEFNQLRQSSIDEELFDVISGSEALLNGKH